MKNDNGRCCTVKYLAIPVAPEKAEYGEAFKFLHSFFHEHT